MERPFGWSGQGCIQHFEADAVIDRAGGGLPGNNSLIDAGGSLPRNIHTPSRPVLEPPRGGPVEANLESNFLSKTSSGASLLPGGAVPAPQPHERGSLAVEPDAFEVDRDF